MEDGEAMNQKDFKIFKTYVDKWRIALGVTDWQVSVDVEDGHLGLGKQGKAINGIVLTQLFCKLCFCHAISVADAIQTRIAVEIADRVDTSLSGSVTRETYEGSVNDREDYVYNATARASYAFRRWAEVYAGYSYDDKDSNTGRLSYTDHTFKIGVDFSL